MRNRFLKKSCNKMSTKNEIKIVTIIIIEGNRLLFIKVVQSLDPSIIISPHYLLLFFIAVHEDADYS